MDGSHSQAQQPGNTEGARIQIKSTPFVMPNDVALLNQVAGNAQKGRRTCEIFLPEDVKEDRLRVDVVSLLSPARSVPPKPEYSIGSKPRKSQKRKKPQVDGEVSRALLWP